MSDNLSPLARLELQRRYRAEQAKIDTLGDVEQAFELFAGEYRRALSLSKHQAREQSWALEKLLNPEWEPQVYNRNVGVSGAEHAQQTVDAAITGHPGEPANERRF